MPRLNLRKAADVPRPRRISGAAQAQQRLYESFIEAVGDNIGELHLGPDEQMRSVKARLSRAARRIGVRIERWDADGRVYFRRWSPRRRRSATPSA
jgi:hypothetical protein